MAGPAVDLAGPAVDLLNDFYLAFGHDVGPEAVRALWQMSKSSSCSFSWLVTRMLQCERELNMHGLSPTWAPCFGHDAQRRNL